MLFISRVHFHGRVSNEFGQTEVPIILRIQSHVMKTLLSKSPQGTVKLGSRSFSNPVQSCFLREYRRKKAICQRLSRYSEDSFFFFFVATVSALIESFMLGFSYFYHSLRVSNRFRHS